MYLKNDGSVGECVFPSYPNCFWPTYNFPELPPDLKFNSEKSTLVGRLMKPTVTGEIEVTVDVICKIGSSFTFHLHINTESYATQKKLDETLEENKQMQKKLDEILERLSKKQSPDADKNTETFFSSRFTGKGDKKEDTGLIIVLIFSLKLNEGQKLMSIDNDDLPYCFSPIVLTWSEQSPTFLRDWLIWNLIVFLVAILREKYRLKND